MYPDIFTFGDIRFSAFATMIIIALIFCLVYGYIFAERMGFRKLGFDEWELIPTILMLFTGAAGARLAYALQNWDFFMHYPEILFMPRLAGVTSYGAIAAGIITIYLWCLWRKKNFLILLDLGAFLAGIGYGIIRIGCFLTGCCYGKVTDLPWGVVFQTVDDLPRHPVQLYASLGVLICYFIMKRLYRVKPFHGFMVLTIIGSYGILRFITEFFRAEPVFWMGLTKAQVASIGLMVFAALVIYVGYSIVQGKKRKGILSPDWPHDEVTNTTFSPTKRQKPEKNGDAGRKKNENLGTGKKKKKNKRSKKRK